MKYEGKPLTLAIGAQHEVELPPRIFRLRLTGLLFENDKTFLLPIAMKGARELVDLYDQHPTSTIVVTGHTDKKGGEAYNVALSDARAEAIGQFLTDDVDGWAKRYEPQPISVAWGTREDQYMLSAVLDAAGQPFYAGPPSGKADANTKLAVQRFQRARGLADDGQAGPDTRRELITSYMQLDGTTLPKSATLEKLGCGEHHNEVTTPDDTAEPKNRRAEIFLFDPGPASPSVPSRCPGAGCPYEAWKEQLDRTDEIDHELCELLIEVVHDKDRKQPIANAAVKLAGSITRQQPSDQHGSAWFRSLVPGRYQLTVEKQDYRTAKLEVMVARHDGGDRFALDGDGGSSGGGVTVPLVTKKLSLKIQDAPYVTAAASEAMLEWRDTTVKIALDRSGDRELTPDKAGVCTTALGESDDHGALIRVERKGPHRQPIKWRVDNYDEEPLISGIPAKPKLEPGTERTFELSTRLRLSMWSFMFPFKKDMEGGIDETKVARLKRTGVDDVSLVYTLSWKQRPKPSSGPALKPIWHPQISDHFRIDASGEGKAVRYLQNLRAALQPEVRLVFGFEMVAVERALDKDFADWLELATDDELRQYAQWIRDFFWDRQIPVDGMGFDFELAKLDGAHAVNMAKLYKMTSETFAFDNGIITYATAAFSEEFTYETAEDGLRFPLSMLYSAAQPPNIIARPMLYDTLSVRGRPTIEPSIAFALSSAPTAGLHPSQLQIGIDLGFAADPPETLCAEVLRPNRVGLCAAFVGKRTIKGVDHFFGEEQYLDLLEKCGKKLNPDEPAPGTTGQPLQVPNGWMK